MRGGTMEKRLRLGVFPNLPKEKVRALLPKLVEFCKAEEIPVVFPREIAESYGVLGYDQETRPVCPSFPWLGPWGETGPSSGLPGT